MHVNMYGYVSLCVGIGGITCMCAYVRVCVYSVALAHDHFNDPEEII